MRKIVNARSSINRKVEYRIITTVEAAGGETIVIKQAAHPEGLAFLDSLITKTAQLAEAMKRVKHVKVVGIKKGDDGKLWSNYVPGSTLDEEFSQALLRRDEKKLVGLLGEVIDIINKLPGSNGKLNPSVVEIFGDFGTDKKIELLDCGYIDFNLDNFIRATSGLCLVDAEFKYDFGVPRQYVLNRLILSYLVRYSHLISSLASESFPILEIGEGLFIPECVWKKYGKHFKSLEASVVAEKNFQKYYSYTKEVRLEILPEKSWVRHTESVFQDATVQLDILRRQQEKTLENRRALEQELEETKKSLSKYRDHWVVRNFNRVRRRLPSLRFRSR